MDLKDRFEHLRTVHFSLLVTCLGLLVVSTTSQDRTIAAAQTQLHALRTIVLNWDELDFDAAIDQQVKVNTTSLPTDRALLAGKDGWYLVDFAAPAWSPRASDTCTPWLYDPMIKRVPRTLSEVHEIWDCLHSSNTVAIPFAFSADAAILHGQKVSIQVPSRPAGAKHLHFIFVSNDEDQRARIRQVFGTAVDYSFVGTLYSDKGAESQVVVPVEKARFITVDLIEPLRRLDPLFASDSGIFAKSFPELDEITSDYSDLTFDKLASILAAQRKHSVQTFEAFSVKFPSEAIARWGIVLLLSIQFYFMMHMAAVQLGRSDDAAVAWLPLYKTVLPQLVFLVTVVTLPAVTVFAVGHTGTISGDAPRDRWLLLAAISLSLFIGWRTVGIFVEQFTGPLPEFLRRFRVSRILVRSKRAH
jgi:hypothetical protein